MNTPSEMGTIFSVKWKELYENNKYNDLTKRETFEKECLWILYDDLSNEPKFIIAKDKSAEWDTIMITNPRKTDVLLSDYDFKLHNLVFLSVKKDGICYSQLVRLNNPH